MLKRYDEVFRTAIILGDAVVVAGAWLLAYLIRFETTLTGLEPGIQDPGDYLFVGAAAVLMSYIFLYHRGLYESRRGLSRLREIKAIFGLMAVVTLLLSALPFFFRWAGLSRAVVLLFWGFSSMGLVLFRGSFRTGLGWLRRRGWNKRYVLIVGTGRLAADLARRLARRPFMGFEILGFLGPDSGEDLGQEILGGFDDLHSLVSEMGIDQVIVAVERDGGVDGATLVETLRDTTATVRIVPDVRFLGAGRPQIEEIGGMPVICLFESPVLGWSMVAKRAFDVVLGGVGLILVTPLLALIAALIKAQDFRAPVLFRQTRMSLDGRSFEMLKFRTMIPDAEAETGPKWTDPSDPRRTRIGALLRRTNLDELPQLWNIVKGEMSLVGPRPERPFFVQQFRKEVPDYMRRHKLKGGLTGWAQVNGLRGSTSVIDRLRYDLEYAQHWSFGLDMKIIALTLFRSFRDPNAY